MYGLTEQSQQLNKCDVKRCADEKSYNINKKINQQRNEEMTNKKSSKPKVLVHFDNSGSNEEPEEPADITDMCLLKVM